MTFSDDHPGHYVASGSAVYRHPKTGVTVEIRTNEDGSLDEVCAPGFHLEQMDDNHWWMDIGGVHINLTATKPIRAEVEPDGSAMMERVNAETVERWAYESHEDAQRRLKMSLSDLEPEPRYPSQIEEAAPTE